MTTLTDKVAILTGASSGIGLATAHALAAEGVHVVAVARSEDKLAELAASLGDRVTPFAADVADPASAERIVAHALDRHGRLDIVLPNAGVYVGGDLVTTDPADIAALVSTNVTGVMTLVRAALPCLLAQGSGDIVVTSSVSGHQDIEWEPVYSASKHAVQSFVHTVRRQTAESGVRVGAIAPGVVLNPLWGFAHGSPEEAARIEERTGIRSADVADAIVFMLTRPAHVVVRDLVLLPTGQPI
ncbi:SDR family oxidoreductase [Microbacterium lushaniae]|uniref:SDR family oxidoreductase n=1 Tax=Microbacterium lushaniae TaxID=2614639 RepID=A0A5J6L754_9MICO|nr:SDR family oxidoreductase [Microbacterium lushaniae]QEW04373.1 SDR family oxidoreductase [Microbacterium lushaniae]